MKKFLDSEGLAHLWGKISMADYPNNETLVAIINAIDEEKADKSDILSIDEIYNEIMARLINADEVSY